MAACTWARCAAARMRCGRRCRVRCGCARAKTEYATMRGGWRSRGAGPQLPYGSPPFDEPGLARQRIIHTKGAFNLLCEGPYDEDIDTIARELDAERRAKLTHALGQKLYDGYHGVMLGVKSITWAMSRKVGGWQSLAYVPMETNYEHVS